MMQEEKVMELLKEVKFLRIHLILASAHCVVAAVSAG